MSKVVSVRERVHQPFYDSLIRSAGTAPGSVTDKTTLFTGNGARTEDRTNLQNGSTLPSDQSHVVLALRAFTHFRNPQLRIPGGGENEIARTGDYSTVAPFLAGGPYVGSAPGTVQDVYRLYWQSAEQLHWNFGTGLKNSIFNMPTYFFPSGQGFSGQLGAQTDLVHFQNNGTDGHSGILRLARAILIPPRQNIICEGTIFSLPDAGQSGTFGLSQASRNMLSLRDSLNAVDLIQKCISFTFDGLFSRDVQ